MPLDLVTKPVCFAATNQSMAVADPFTGAGAYVPSNDAGSDGANLVTNPDPFTGAGAYVPDDPSAASASTATPPGLVYVPHQQYQGFETVPPADKVVAKLRELSGDVHGENALSDDELASGGAVDEIVTVNLLTGACPLYIHMNCGCIFHTFEALLARQIVHRLSLHVYGDMQKLAHPLYCTAAALGADCHCTVRVAGVSNRDAWKTCQVARGAALSRAGHFPPPRAQLQHCSSAVG